MDTGIAVGMGPTSEAVAHFVHGGATIFFIVWSILLYQQRKQSNMMYMLWVNMLWLAICNLKDMVFLVDGLWEDPYLTGISVTVDLIYVPIMCCFFFEVVSPGWVSLGKVLWCSVMQLCFIPLFIIFPDTVVYEASLIYAYVFGTVSMIIVCMLAVRHQKYIKDNYSYTEYINVTWTVVGGLVMFACMTVYFFAFTEETWLGNALYYGISFVAWVYLYVLSLRHNVVDIPKFSVFYFPWVKSDSMNKEEAENMSAIFASIGEELQKAMSIDKLYLNPRLTLSDVASFVGTNRTYLSEYLNNILHKSFYEYINEWRVKEACRIMDDASGRRMTMQEVAEMSGFNSGSTFNRSFARLIGMTPSAYARKRG